LRLTGYAPVLVSTAAGSPAAGRKTAGRACPRSVPRRARRRPATAPARPRESSASLRIPYKSVRKFRLSARLQQAGGIGQQRVGGGTAGSGVRVDSKDARRLFVARGTDLDRVAGPHQLKELLQVRARHANASVRRCLADGIGFVGPVNAVAMLT